MVEGRERKYQVLYGFINKRRKNNEFLNLEVNGIKNAVLEHFQSLFAARGVRHIPANMNFKSLDGEHIEDLVRKF
jgi:hypothetical protein